MPLTNLTILSIIHMEPIPIPQDPVELREAIGAMREERDSFLRSVVMSGAEALASEIAEGKSEHLIRYLDFATRFYRYSAHNQALIAAQCPEASFVAAFRRWSEMGYQVRRGERGIRIFAPRPYQEKDEESGEIIKQGIYFIVVVVFDANQVGPMPEKVALPIPTFFRPLGNEAKMLSNRLLNVVISSGIRVTEESGLGETQGISHGGAISIKSGLDQTNRFLTMLHEYAHEILHQIPDRKGEARSIKECEAEAVSYIVARHFDIHNPFSSDYLLQWGNSGVELMAQLDAIQRASAQIIDSLERPEMSQLPHQRTTHQRRGHEADESS